MKNNRKKNKTFLNSIYFKMLVALIVVLSGFLGYRFALSSQVKKWDKKIYPGVTVYNVNLSGKTKREAKEILNEELSWRILDKKINFNVDDKVYTYTYNDIGAEYDIEKVVDDAFNYGKNLSLSKRYKLIKKETEKQLKASFKYNEEKLAKIEEKIKSETEVPYRNASININYGNINVIPERLGCRINSEDLHNKLVNSIDGNINGDTTIEVDCIDLNPQITSKELERIKSIPMSTYSTVFGSSNAARSENLKIATSLVDGTLLMPGEEFSYSEVSQRGRGQYLDAAVYINNKVEQAEAGGICQISSTLYNAVMKANIKSTTRINHSLPVSYVPLGLDATVAWGYLDYKFKNPYDFPIYIEGIISNGEVIFNIYGDPEVLNGATYSLTSNVLETIEPEIIYEDDSTIPKGEEVIETQGQVGYKVESFLVGYKDGVEVSREFIAKDTYAKVNTVIKRGTKE